MYGRGSETCLFSDFHVCAVKWSWCECYSAWRQRWRMDMCVLCSLARGFHAEESDACLHASCEAKPCGGLGVRCGYSFVSCGGAMWHARGRRFSPCFVSCMAGMRCVSPRIRTSEIAREAAKRSRCSCHAPYIPFVLSCVSCSSIRACSVWMVVFDAWCSLA